MRLTEWRSRRRINQKKSDGFGQLYAEKCKKSLLFYHFPERFLAIFLFKLCIPINFVAERVSNDGRNEYRRPTICKMARIEKSACAHTDASPSRRLCRDTQRHLHRTVRRWWCHALPHATDIPEHQTGHHQRQQP